MTLPNILVIIENDCNHIDDKHGVCSFDFLKTISASVII